MHIHAHLYTLAIFHIEVYVYAASLCILHLQVTVNSITGDVVAVSTDSQT